MRDASWAEKLSLYEDWYNQEMPNLFGYLFYQTQDRATAEELTSATCLRALERLDQFDPSRGHLKDWIFGIARNQFREHLRSQYRRPAPIALSDVRECLITDEGFELDYDQQETFLEVLGHIEGLGEREREIIALRYGAGFPNMEIASMLGITSNHVAVLLRRALVKLRNELGAKVHDVS